MRKLIRNPASFPDAEALPNFTYTTSASTSNPVRSDNIQSFDIEISAEEEVTTPGHWSKFKNVLQSKSAMRLGFVLNLFYTVMVSALFAAFAYRRAAVGEVSCTAVEDSDINVPLGLFYAFSSIVMNAPMAWFFSETTIAAIKRLSKKREHAFKAAFVVGSFLALFTTTAGLKVARESVDGLEKIPFTAWVSSIPGLEEILTFMSAANTFMTRFVGSVFVLFALWQFAKSFVRRRQAKSAAYYEFLDDLERYGDQVDVKIPKTDSEADDLKQYMQQFYTELYTKGIHPGSSWKHTLIDAAVMTGTLLIGVTLILNMMPLWIKLTVGGAESISKSLSSSALFVLTAAASNELFYANSGRLFIPRCIDFAKQGYANAKAKFGASSRKAISGVIVSATVGLAAWAIFAYFSGGGYGEDGVKAVKCGFGEMADSLWFSWMGWYTNLFIGAGAYANVIAQGAAGSIVNGGAALGFALSRIPWFQKTSESALEFGSQTAKTTLEKAIEIGDFDSGLNNQIQIHRKAANPHKTVWESCSLMWRRCRGVSEEETPLDPLSINQIYI